MGRKPHLGTCIRTYHHIPAGWPRPNSTVHFVTDGIESAVNQAKAAAAGKLSASPVGLNVWSPTADSDGGATVTRPRRVALFFMSLRGLQAQG